MERLMALQPIHSPEANKQSEEILSLMANSASENKDFAIYYPGKELHPLVIFVLTSKGYRIEDITLKNSDGSVVFGASKCYRIGI